MMGNVNRIPRGLLAYLDSQTQGENPASMGAVVAPTLDMERFYRSAARYSFGHAGNLSFDSLTDHATLTVPENEIWFLHNASVSVQNNTGASANYAVAISLVPVGASLADYLALLAQPSNTTVADGQWLRAAWNGPVVVLIPGVKIRAHLDRITAAGVGTSGYLDILYNAMQI